MLDTIKTFFQKNKIVVVGVGVIALGYAAWKYFKR